MEDTAFYDCESKPMPMKQCVIVGAVDVIIVGSFTNKKLRKVFLQGVLKETVHL